MTDEHVAAVVSGGNVNLTEHAELTRTGLIELGRYAEARLHVDGWPTAIADVAATIESRGAELDSLERDDRSAVDHPNRVPVTVGIEGSGPNTYGRSSTRSRRWRRSGWRTSRWWIGSR